ncbi:MAG: NAD-dependent epimerase/dehydratase family protein [bacterium]
MNWQDIPEKLRPVVKKPVFINEDAVLLDAFRLVYDPPYSVLIVRNQRAQLLGILTEGDMRRHLLQGNALHSNIRECMQKDPILLQYSAIDDTEYINSIIHQLMRKVGNQIWEQAVIPIVDDDRHAIGLISASGLSMLRDGVVPQTDTQQDGLHRRILLVGGAGFIGSVVSTLLVEHGYQIRVLDNLLYTENSLDHLTKEQCELLHGNAKSIDTLVEALEDVDAVVYLAEIVGDPACKIMPKNALKTNYLALASIAHLCSYLQVKRFIYTSSCSVYGASRNKECVLTEESITNPVSLYARIKLMSEGALFSMPGHTFSPTILRLATVFGNSYRPRFDLVVNVFTAQAYFDKKIRVFGGDQFRPNVHVSDVASAILHVLEAPIGQVGKQIFNVGGTQNNHTIQEVAEFVREVFPETEIEVVHELSDPRNYRIDSSKLANTVGFGDYKTVKEGIEDIKHMLEQLNITDYRQACYSNVATATAFLEHQEKGSGDAIR